MKSYVSLTIILCMIMIFCPLITLASRNKDLSEDETQAVSVFSQAIIKDEQEQESEKISVLQVSSGKVIELTVYDYVLGVIASEMPSSYHKEALKAQAVASYTYALWIKNNADNSKGELYDITDDSSKHQNYTNEDELKAKWGEKYESNIAVYKEALNEVLGEYLSYNNEPVLAVYHAISSGTTESSSIVWQSELPYLKSVNAIGDTLSPDYDSQSIFTKEELLSILQNEEADIAESDIFDFSHTQSENSDYITELSFGDKKFTGIEIMSLFSLSSPNFTLEYSNEKFIFNVKGKGHGIGMSQYSADYMARQGSTYKEILEHFYSGAKLVSQQS